MVAAIPVITIKDEEDEIDPRVGHEEYKKIHKDVVEYMMFRLFIANAKGTFFGMSESLEASSRR